MNLAAQAPRMAWVIQLTARYAPRRFYSTIPGWLETTAKDHTLLLEAIQQRNPEVARAAMANHIMVAGEQLARHIESRADNNE